MLRLNITKEELVLLEQHFHASQIELIRLKAHTMLLYHKHYTPEQIADILMRSVRSIQRWLSDFSKLRLSSLFSGLEGNENASKLTRKQKQEISKVLKQPVTEDSLLPKKFWDVGELKEYVSAHFGVVYESDRSYHYLLKLGNLSFKYPDAFNRRRDEELIQRRMREIREEIQPFMKDESWEVITADETGLQEKNLVKRAWLEKGKKTVVKIRMEHEMQSYIGFLNEKDKEFSCYEIEKGTQEEVIKALVRLKKKYKKKKLCVIWDNAGFHKGKKIREELRKGGKLEGIYLINFPPYAPEYNPVEHVWNTAKQEVAKYRTEGFEKMKRLFRVVTHEQTFNYNL